VKGESVFAFVVCRGERPTGDVSKLVDELRKWVTQELGALARPDDIRFADNLPKTRSGKIMRRLLRSVARGDEITQDVSTLENPSILDQLRGTDTGSTAKLPTLAAKKPAKKARKAAKPLSAAKPVKAAKLVKAAKPAKAADPAKAVKPAKVTNLAKAAKKAPSAPPKAATKKTARKSAQPKRSAKKKPPEKKTAARKSAVKPAKGNARARKAPARKK
jgi:AMP-binding enzyme